jgi:copper resistance protein B
MSRPYKLLVLLLIGTLPPAVFGHGDDDPLLTAINVDQLEQRFDDDASPLTWEVEAWRGHDLRKWWLKSRGEADHGETESAEIQLLYGMAISPYWDILMGVKQDLEPDPRRHWGVITLHGLAPGFIETDLELFVGEAGHSAVRLTVDRELFLTPQWVLMSELALNAQGKADSEAARGSGLSSIEAGLRLGYRVTPQLVPYLGYSYEKRFGKTADFYRDKGEAVSQNFWLMGVKLRF